jgi:hypothetical protein
MRLPRLLRRLVGKAIKLLDRFAVRISRVGQVDGIFICDLTPRELSKSTFLQPTREALELIQKFDPRRYRRVVQYIKYIVNRPMISSGSYERARHMCNVDYNKRFTVDSPWKLNRYACLLIHEATHGRLMAMGLPYNDKTWERTEKLCHLEEYRFIRQVDGGWADLFCNPKKFNPEYWRRRRESREFRQAAWRKRGEEWHQERRKIREESDRENRTGI